MAKSKYPSSLDTSKELPVVRENITEITGEIINSLRSAILNIERTLGINPQGAAGNSVATRLNALSDGNGVIKKEALTLAGVLSGPIIDADVSNVAAISESKLRLDFPTHLLQDEISIISSELNSISAQISELNSLISTHVHPDASNRHKAVAITVSSAVVNGSSDAFKGITAPITAQEAFENIVDGHINFSGSVSATNNSHTASQIFFDTGNVDDVIFQTNMQGAMEDLANLESIGLRNNTLNLASNGRIRTGSIFDAFEDNNLGDTLLSSSNVSYVREGSRARFTFASPQTPIKPISTFDYFNLSNAANEEDNKSYQIAEVLYSGTDVSAVIVFGVPSGDSDLGLTATITKNPYQAYSINSLNATVRPRLDKSNTPDIIIANPNAATIISSGLRPQEITLTSNEFQITIDGGSAISIETYDSVTSEQTLSSIVNKINEQATDQNLNFLAYRVKVNNCFELGLCHILPNQRGDIKNRSLMISAGSSNDGTTQLGFSSSLDQEYEGLSGSSYHINGYIIEKFGRIIELTRESAQIIAGTNTVSLFDNTFSALGVRVGDVIVISGSETEADDGSYRISNISEDTITLDSPSIELSGAISEQGNIYIVRCSANISEMNFTESVSSDGSILFDVFVSEDQDVHYSKRLEVDGAIASGGLTAVVSDVSKGFIYSGQTATITVSTTGIATLTDPTLTDGPSIFIGETGRYKLFASDNLSFVTIDVFSSGLPSSDQVIALHGFDEINRGNLHICRGTFATSLGRVLGEYTDSGIPSVIDKRHSGTVDETIVGESLLERYIQGPRNELRSSGVISGLGISNLNLNGTFYEIDIDAGIAFVSGIRHEYPGFETFRVNSLDDFFVGIDQSGCIVVSDRVTNPDDASLSMSGMADQDIVFLAYVDISESNIIDLRRFINRLDLKDGKIVVSNTSDFGHFTNVSSAVNYARLFHEIYPDELTPEIYISRGTYEVSQTIIIDFDVKISGAGPSTIIMKSDLLATGVEPVSGNIDFGSALFLIGESSEAGSARISDGVTISNFTYKSSASLDSVGTVITLAQPLVAATGGASPDATYRFENINFIGPSNITYGTGADADLLGEFSFAIGQSDASTFAPSSNIEVGAVIISNCRMTRMGVEYGGILFSESASSTFKNIIISNVIASDMSPNVGDMSFGAIQTPVVPTLENVIEANIARS